jgi:hypothetical protein
MVHTMYFYMGNFSRVRTVWGPLSHSLIRFRSLELFDTVYVIFRPTYFSNQDQHEYLKAVYFSMSVERLSLKDSAFLRRKGKLIYLPSKIDKVSINKKFSLLYYSYGDPCTIVGT